MSSLAEVRWAELDRLDHAGFAALLSPDELSRAGAFISDLDRDRFVAARGTLRTLLGERLGRDPKAIKFAYGKRGKPRLADDSRLRFNLSYSRGIVALALCEGREVGIDVEVVRDGVSIERIARRYLPARATHHLGGCPDDDGRSLEFFRAWVRQEAYAKARGAGLEGIGEWPDPARWAIVDLDLRDGYAAAIAIEGPSRARLTAMPL
jgi:4'-phosphopantetheinyl transferase